MMIIFKIIAYTLCMLNVFGEFMKDKEVSEKVLLWLILSFSVIN